MKSSRKLKAILFDFNGIIINDESIHEALIEQLMIEENMRLQPGEFRQICLGRSDRCCLTDLLQRRGRYLSHQEITELLQKKSQAYQELLQSREELPIYPGLYELINYLQEKDLKLAIVSGALRAEIEWVLTSLNLLPAFSVIVSGDDLETSKPDPQGYLLTVERLQHLYPQLHLLPGDCLALEDSHPGIQAAHAAKIPVVGVAHTYPLHLLQRWATWSVDSFADLEWERLESFFIR